MIIELIPAEGIGGGPPIQLAATQVVIRQDNGTIIGIAMHYGPDGAYALAMAGDEDGDFERLLAAAGIRETVICDHLKVPQPHPGAVLVSDPRKKRYGSTL